MSARPRRSAPRTSVGRSHRSGGSWCRPRPRPLSDATLLAPITRVSVNKRAGHDAFPGPRSTWNNSHVPSVHAPGRSGEKEANTVSRRDDPRSTWNIGGSRNGLSDHEVRAAALSPANGAFGEGVSRETCAPRAVQQPREKRGLGPTFLCAPSLASRDHESLPDESGGCVPQGRNDLVSTEPNPAPRAPRLLHVKHAPR